MKTSKKSSTQKKNAVKPVPAGMHTVTPLLVCAGGAQAIAFYKKAFAAEELSRLEDDQGRILHASVRIGDSAVMLTDEVPAMNALGPKARGGTSVTIHLYVPDVDAEFARAIKAGAKVIMPLQNMFWGDRYGILEDPFGHNWSIASHVQDLTPKQIKAAMKEACG